MKVFVTGHQGYIGSQLVDLLKQEGHCVIGCDLNLFEGCGWELSTKPDRELQKDTRKIEAADLDGCDCHNVGHDQRFGPGSSGSTCSRCQEVDNTSHAMG